MIVDCKYCSKSFTARTYRKLFCSDRCKVRYNRENRLTCYYCGDLAASKDHVTPHSTMGLSKRVWAHVDYVMCCKECNYLIGNNFPYSMADRINYLIEKFTKRHKLDRTRVQWDEDELDDCTKSFADSVRAHMRLWNNRQARLDHMRLRYIHARNDELESMDKELPSGDAEY